MGCKGDTTGHMHGGQQGREGEERRGGGGEGGLIPCCGALYIAQENIIM